MIVFLIGMPGTGKSHWLHKLAKHYKMPAADMDVYITEREGQSIAQLFEKGEAYFRQKEREALLQLIAENAHQDIIVATGGGTPCYLHNMDTLLQSGTVIYLKGNAAFLYDRLKKAKTPRPLLEAVPEPERLAFVAELLKTRKEYYERAHFTIEALSASLANFEMIFKTIKLNR